MTRRPIRIEGDVAYVPLSQGREAIIDAADVDLIGRWRWSVWCGRGGDYAVRGDYSGAKRVSVSMHRVIMNNPDAMVDHIDGNGLNNRRSNLRLASDSQNQQNRKISVNNTSGVKGVGWHGPRQKWRARLKLRGREISLGYYACKTAAAIAQARGIQEYYGEFGRIK